MDEHNKILLKFCKSCKFCLVLILFIISTGNVFSMNEVWKSEMGGQVVWVYADDPDEDSTVEILVHVIKESTIEKYGVIYILDDNYKIIGKIDDNTEIFDIQVFDFDRDDEKEIIIATGKLLDNNVRNPYGTIKVFNKTGGTEQKYSDMGFFRSVYAGDVNGDRRNEIIAASGYEHATQFRQECFCDIYFLNRRFDPDWKFKVYRGENIMEKFLCVYAEDLDNILADGKMHKEIIATTSSGKLYVLDSSNVVIDNEGYAENIMLWNYSPDGISKVYAEDLDDPVELRNKTAYPCNATVTNNGITQTKESVCYRCNITECNENCSISCKEVIAGTGAGTVYVFNSSGKLRWSYKTPGKPKSEIIDVLISDINNDKKQGIIAGSDAVYALDNNGNLLWKYKTKKAVTTLYTADLDNDNFNEIIAGTEEGLCIIGSDGILYENYEINDVKSVCANDIDNDSVMEIIAGIDSNIHIFKINETNLRINSAKKHYEIAQDYYENGNYNATISYANKSHIYYTKVNHTEGISKSIQLINDARDKIYIKLRVDEAKKYFEIALNYSENNDTVNASIYAELSREIYIELNDTEKITVADALILKCEGEKTEEIDETIEITGTDDENITVEEKSLIRKIIDRELEFYGIPVLYVILIVILISGVLISQQAKKRKQEELEKKIAEGGVE